MGKRRLSGAVDPATRAELGRGLANHVASTVVSAGHVPLIVTAEPEVAEWATLDGFPSIPDPGQGLDAAAATGVDWAEQSGSDWIVLHSDLPLLAVSDVAALSAPLDAGRTVISPSADGGTSAIGAGGSMDFSFGLSSFHRHLKMLGDPVIVARPGLLLDIDAPADLRAALTRSRGAWLGDLITAAGPNAARNLY